MLPFPIEKPLYPREPNHPDFVFREYFNKNLHFNMKLKQEKEELSMQVFEFRQEKMDLAHKLKERDELLGEYGFVMMEGLERSQKLIELEEVLLQLSRNKGRHLKKRSSKSIETVNPTKPPKQRWRENTRPRLRTWRSNFRLRMYNSMRKVPRG